MDRNVTPLSARFNLRNLARSPISTIYERRLKREGYDADVVQDGLSLKRQLRNLIKAAHASSVGGSSRQPASR
jgi:hypothetical protein